MVMEVDQLVEELRVKDKLIELLSNELLRTEVAIRDKAKTSRESFRETLEESGYYDKDRDYLEPIKEYLAANPSITVEQAAKDLGCSVMTVKRGLTCLQKSF